jgi:cytochrome c biogenesis protein CcmG, thiol:disulfide interchange protein DsbE
MRFRARLPLLLATAVVACGPKVIPPSLDHPLASSSAPEFHEFSTSDYDVGVPNLGTKVTVLDFWATWCDECQRTMPAFEKLYQDRKSDGVMVIGVSIDEDTQAAKSRAIELRASYPIVLDPGMRIASRYRVGKIPLAFVVDQRGQVRWIGRDPDDMRRAVDAVLAE